MFVEGPLWKAVFVNEAFFPHHLRSERSETDFCENVWKKKKAQIIKSYVFVNQISGAALLKRPNRKHIVSLNCSAASLAFLT